MYHHARVLIDGKLVAEAPGWELPKTFLLPGQFRAGAEHELCIGVTDYIVGLPDRVKPPAGGPMQPVGRGMAAPIGTTNELSMEFDCAPEFYPVPLLRAEHTAVRTMLTGGKRITARVELRNDGSSRQIAGVRFTVLAAGKPVFTWVADKTVSVNPGQSQLLESGTAWPDAILWSPETPPALRTARRGYRRR